MSPKWARRIAAGIALLMAALMLMGLIVPYLSL